MLHWYLIIYNPKQLSIVDRIYILIIIHVIALKKHDPNGIILKKLLFNEYITLFRLYQ